MVDRQWAFAPWVKCATADSGIMISWLVEDSGSRSRPPLLPVAADRVGREISGRLGHWPHWTEGRPLLAVVKARQCLRPHSSPAEPPTEPPDVLI